MSGARLVLLTLLLLVGCASAPPLVVDLARVRTTVPTALVARKLERPLYILLDDRVPKQWDLSTTDRQVTLEGFDLFVARDIKAALAPYFESVQVVNTTGALPSVPYALVEVTVDKVELHYLDAGKAKSSGVEMNWSLAVRVSEANEFAFTYRGSAVSREVNSSFQVACVQMTEAATAGMLRRWTQEDVVEKLRSFTRAGAAGH